MPVDCTVHPDVKHNGQKALSVKVHHEITGQQDTYLTASFTTTHELSSVGYWHIILLNMHIRTQICIIINAFCTFGTGFLSILKSFLRTLGCDTPSMQRSTYKRFTIITLLQLCHTKHMQM